MLLNQLVVQATVMAAWNAYVSSDGMAGNKEPGWEPHVWQRQRANGEANQGDGGRRGQGPHKRREHPRDPRAQDLEHVHGVEGLKVEGRAQQGGNKPCKELYAVRLLLFGHLERSNLLRDGDKPGTFLRGQRDRLSIFSIK
jgi:hypothetical protein